MKRIFFSNTRKMSSFVRKLLIMQNILIFFFEQPNTSKMEKPIEARRIEMICGHCEKH